MRTPTQEHYSILKISKTATLDELKKSYRKRAFELHPDLHPDNPNANKDFQLLNEAYVVLTDYLSPNNRDRAKAAASYGAQKSSTGKASSSQSSKESTFYKHKENAKEEYKSEPRTETHKRTYSKAQSNHERAKSAYNYESSKAQSQTFNADNHKPSQEEVMQDILNDPFARRVYEDIYRSLNEEEQGFTSPFTHEKKKKSNSFNLNWVKNKIKDFSNSTSQDDVNSEDLDKEVSPVKSWLRGQIDESIEYYLPIQSLYPRSRIRLQIGKGFSSEKRTVEITLPTDFIIGKPIRLAGLGKKVGKWQGDLYITFLPSADD